MLFCIGKKWNSFVDETWKNCMLQFLGSNVCYIFVKADVHRAVREAKGTILMMKLHSDSVNDNADFTDEFHFGDGGPDYEWSAISIEYSYGLGLK